MYGEDKRYIQILLGKPEGKGPFGKPRQRWENNIKNYLQKTGWRSWIRLILLRIGTGFGLL
jgi:hypothetical protein